MECFGNFYYLDGTIMPAGHDDEIVPGEVSFYEVIRTREGIPLFFDDHMKRLGDGIATRYDSGGDISERVREGLDALVSVQSFPEINARVTVTFTGHEYSLHICYIPSSYPDEEMISRGVGLILYHAERFDPGVKLLNKRLRLSVNEELVKRKAYEALLVNSEGCITEGSRSNVFFVKGNELFTAPVITVLPGITRLKVFEVCQSEGIKINEVSLPLSEITSYDSVFITGTSRKILPVRQIDELVFATENELIKRISLKFDAITAEYIRQRKA